VMMGRDRVVKRGGCGVQCEGEVLVGEIVSGMDGKGCCVAGLLLRGGEKRKRLRRRRRRPGRRQ
jgi:hypothetical protein